MIHYIFFKIKSLLGYDTTLEALYTGKWQTTRKKHLEKQSCCQVCGAIKNLNVHHIIPVSVDPSKEDDPDNLITLCEDKCHLIFGHLFFFKSHNKNVREDVEIWRKKIQERP